MLGATREGLAPAKEQPGKMVPKYKSVTPGIIFCNPMRILFGSIAFVDVDDAPEVVDLKEDLKRLKKGKTAAEDIDGLNIKIAEAEKAYRNLETQAANIDAAVFDLKAVNPNVVAQVDNRTPREIIDSINAQGRIVSDALARLSALVADNLVARPSAESIE